MADKNQIVSVELNDLQRKKLGDQLLPEIVNLDLGFELPSEWPYEGEVTLAQLVVIAQKLGKKIVITNLEII